MLQQKHDIAVGECMAKSVSSLLFSLVENRNFVSVDRDDLHSKFSRSVLELQEKSSLKYAVLERKIQAIRKELVRLLRADFRCGEN